MADIAKVRSAYAFFQGKRQPTGGEQVATATAAPAAPQLPVAPKPATPPAMGQDIFAGTAQIIAELERRIGELETALKEAKKQATATVATPPINPVPATATPTVPVIDELNKGIQQVNVGIAQAESQIAGEINKFNQELSQGINKVNTEVSRVTTQINQVNTALQTQIPAIATQVNQTVNAFKGIFDAFKGIKF